MTSQLPADQVAVPVGPARRAEPCDLPASEAGLPA